MLPDLVNDVNMWAQAIAHLFECEQESCVICLAIAESCSIESAELETAFDSTRRMAS
jgi:hypothetical protein